MRVSAYELKCSHFCILSKVILMNLSERELEGVDSESPIIQKAFTLVSIWEKKQSLTEGLTWYICVCSYSAKV